MLWEVSGSIGEDFGMIGRRTEKLKKSSLELESKRYTGRVEFTLKSGHGACLTKIGAVDHAEHDPCQFSANQHGACC